VIVDVDPVVVTGPFTDATVSPLAVT